MPVCTGKAYLLPVVGGGVLGFFDGELLGFALAVGVGAAVGVPSADALDVADVSIGSKAGAPVGCRVSAQPVASAVTVTNRTPSRPGPADPPHGIRP
ncbi:hypothetical protein GCM10022225_18390 [Plantactinospora mayteni]|uniref:Uncharacterized protein n=1 Tax=Plantactinospora mayteni TaxID=566021 RepID=A0ABQ4EMZ9_9ACTN|nr:hypothetical protein Pma05_25980 [Plantactinospora mayteni]